MPRNKNTAPVGTEERLSTEAHAQKRRWSTAQRLALLTEYESYPKGDPRRGELLRRHGLYTSHMSKWRVQREQGALASQQLRSPGRPAQPADPQRDQIMRLERELARLQAELHKATTIIEIQKKVTTLLGAMPPMDEH